MGFQHPLFADRTEAGRRLAEQLAARGLTPFLDEPQRYGAAAMRGAAHCEDEVVAQLVTLLEHRAHYVGQDGEDYLDAEQNARVVKAAEAYYRAMYRASVASWNLRDSHMFDTLSRLL